MDIVEIKSSEGAVRLVLSNPEPSDREPDYFVATVEDAGLRASARVYAYGASGIAALFEDVAANWRGWEGEKTGGTVEGDLCLTCTSDRLGHTFVRVEISSGPYDHDWRAEATIRLDAVQLDEVAQSLRRFFRPEHRAV